MFTPVKSGYAYGSGIGKQFNRAAISNTGIVNGFRASTRRFPEERVTVIVLSNLSGAKVASITGDLAAMVFDESYRLPQKRREIMLNPALIDSYVGSYRVDDNFSVIISNENGKLAAEMGGLPKQTFSAQSETDFSFDEFDFQLKFIRSNKGQVTQLKGAGLWWADFIATKIK
jgi:hypothetical protein